MTKKVMLITDYDVKMSFEVVWLSWTAPIVNV